MGFRDTERFRKIYSYYRPRPRPTDNLNITDIAGILALISGSLNGIDWKQSVRIASDGNISITGTFTNLNDIDSGATSTPLVDEDRILIKGQSTGSENGIYIWYASDGKLVRSLDAVQDTLTSGAACYVEEGTYATQVWLLSTTDPITVDTTSLTWIQIGGGTGSPGGPDHSVQFNDGGLLNGSSNFSYDLSTLYLTGSFSQGNASKSDGIYSHAEGNFTLASGSYSHTEGSYTYANSESSHAEGFYATAGCFGYHSSDAGNTTPGVVILDSSYGDVTSQLIPGNYIIFDDTKFAYAYGIINVKILSATFNSPSTEITLEYPVGSAQANIGALGIISPIGADAEIGPYAHAEGYNTKVQGLYSHAEGNSGIASGIASHAEGNTTFAKGNNSHAEGTYTTSAGDNSHAEGFQSIAYGPNSHAEGYASNSGYLGYASSDAGNTTPGVIVLYPGHGDVSSAFSPGNYIILDDTLFSNNYGVKNFEILSVTFNSPSTEITLVDGTVSTSLALIGKRGDPSPLNAFLQLGSNSHSEGFYTLAQGDNSHTEGYRSVTSNLYAHAEGYETIASGESSHAEGRQTVSSGKNSHAEGFGSLSSGEYSHAEGSSNALGEGSHSEGGTTSARGHYSHAEGYGTISKGFSSHSEGGWSEASGSYSHAEGIATVASGSGQHVSGKYNKRGNDFSLFVIGDGTGDSDVDRSDIVRVNSGSVGGTGRFEVTGTFVATNGLSGSLTKLSDGTSYLIAGSNVTITSASNGAVTISSTGGGGGDSYFTSTTAGSIYTTGSTAFIGGLSIDSPQDIGSDVFFFVSGSTSSRGGSTPGVAAFGGDLVVTGSLLVSGTTEFYADIIEVSGSLLISGAAEINGNLHANHVYANVITSSQGFSGSLTKLSDGTSYLIAGSNVSIVSSSNGAITISSTAVDSYWTSPSPSTISTTGSVIVQGDLTVNGTTTTIDTVNLEVKDAVIGLGFSSGTIALSANDRGIIGGISGGDNVTLIWKNSQNEFSFGRTSSSATGSLPVPLTSYSNIHAANIQGSIITASLGFSGSLTSLIDGTSYLIAGPNVTIASASNGAVTISASSTLPASPNNSVQFNNGGIFGGSSNFNFYNSTNTLALTGTFGMKGDVIPDIDFSYNLGAPDKRWSNVYTGDLHLKNDRGDWTIVEEKDYLCVVNNITGKKYKMMLQEIKDES